MTPDGQDYTCEHGEPWGECCPMPYVQKLRSAFVTTDGLDSLPVPVPVVSGLLYADSLAWLVGKPGSMKSLIALDVAGCVATGETWMGRATKSGPVVYIWAEGTHGLRQRVRAWEHAYGHPMSNVHFLPVPVQAANGGHWDALVTVTREMRPTLVVVDTQARVTTGMDENSAEDMGTFVARLDQLRAATKACVWPVHHQGRNGEHMRGSTALDGAADVVWRTEREGDTVTVSMGKPPKDGPPFDPFTLRLVPMLDSVTLAPTDGRANNTPPKWLETWAAIKGDEWVSVSVLVKAEVTSEATLHRHLKGLVDSGKVEKKGEGSATRYRLSTLTLTGLSHSHPTGGESDEDSHARMTVLSDDEYKETSANVSD